jgi:cystathionine beta-lyase/cystathionine gamma-synthase
LKNNYSSIETQLITAGEPEPRVMGAVGMPVFQSSTYEYAGEQSYHEIRYIRLNNTPNHIALNKKIAAIENGEAAMVAASGMAAISTALLAVLNRGDHLLAQNILYGGTFDFITKDFMNYGIEHDLIDCDNPDEWKSKLKPNTKAIYCESITNPMMQVGDLKAVVNFAKKNNLISLIDNTFTSPVNFKPLDLGFDLSLHSCTKYLNGHNDIVAGAVVGKAELIEKFTHKLNHLGGTLDPHACFLLHRGLKTLSLRVRYQNQSALKVAKFLDGHEKVAKVNYAGLESSKYYRRACELFIGCGGMMSFELKGGLQAAEKMINGLEIPIYAPSLGGVETLIILPSKTSHILLTPEERRSTGITEGLIRLSVGIENSDDLIADFNTALSEL